MLLELKGQFGVRKKGTNYIYTKVLVSEENVDKFEILNDDPNAVIIEEEQPIVIEETPVEENA